MAIPTTVAVFQISSLKRDFARKLLNLQLLVVWFVSEQG